MAALYIGGMGARGKNFYNDVCRDYGFADEATAVQDAYQDGRKDEAAGLLEDDGVNGFYGKERVTVARPAVLPALLRLPLAPAAAVSAGRGRRVDGRSQ